MSSNPKKRGKRRDYNKKPARTRGEYGFSVPEAGALIGLGRNASYEAAKKGEMPVLEIGGLKIVPRIPWLKKIGAPETV